MYLIIFAASAPASPPTQVYAAVPGPPPRMNTNNTQPPQSPTANTGYNTGYNNSNAQGPAPANPSVPTVQGYAVAQQAQAEYAPQEQDYLQPEQLEHVEEAPQVDMYSKGET